MSILVPIILIVSSIGIFFGYINPAYTAVTGSSDLTEKSVKELQSVEQDYVDALNKTAQIETVREGLLTKFNTLSLENREKIFKLLPDHIDSVRLIIDTNNIASRYGMSLSDIKLFANSIVDKNNPAGATGSAQNPNANTANAPQQIGPDSSLYDSVKLGFSMSGPYENFLLFLSDVQKSLRIVDITSIAFENSDTSAPPAGSKVVQTSGPEIYKYSINLRTYFLK
ncbi:MAG: hypothetical protein V4467_02500 [Patescibacteria group bacterium]